jgi:cell division protein FtsQ
MAGFDDNARDAEQGLDPDSSPVSRMDGAGDEESESPFLREPQRVPPRRRAAAKPSTRRLRWIVLTLFALAVLVTAAVASWRYGTTNWRYRFSGGESIEVSGNTHVTREEIRDVFGADIGRNIFQISLNERRRALEHLPWVEAATVMRILPNRLRVVVRERNPVAFVRLDKQVQLIDAKGALMSVPPVAQGQSPLSFPVITGMTDGDPLSMRAARMKIYMQLLQELNAGNPNYLGSLDEVDLGDPEDLQVTVSDAGGVILLHLGASEPGSNRFLTRFKVYVDSIGEWRRDHPHILAADLRNEGRYYIDPGAPGPEAAPAGATQPASPDKPSALPEKKTQTKPAAAGGAAHKAAATHAAAKKHGSKE